MLLRRAYDYLADRLESWLNQRVHYSTAEGACDPACYCQILERLGNG